MIIIIEGPDGAGKSTLAHELVMSHSNANLVHFGKPNNDEEAYEYWKVYASHIEMADPERLTVFDRSWYSDMVYGPIMRNREEIEPIQVRMLEALVIANGGGFVIHCTAPTSVLWSRCKKRGEIYIEARQQLQDIATKYEHIFTEYCTLPVVLNRT